MDLTTEGNSALLKRLEEMQKRIDRNERDREIAEAEKRGREQGRKEVWDGVKKAVTIFGWIVALVGGVAGAVWMVARALSSVGVI